MRCCRSKMVASALGETAGSVWGVGPGLGCHVLRLHNKSNHFCQRPCGSPHFPVLHSRARPLSAWTRSSSQTHGASPPPPTQPRLQGGERWVRGPSGRWLIPTRGGVGWGRGSSPQRLHWAMYGKEHRLIAVELSGHLYLDLELYFAWRCAQGLKT